MSARSRQEYFQVLRERYRKSESKTQRSRIIKEAVVNTGLHRKSVIRALRARRNPEGGPPDLGRPRKYSGACLELLKRLYRASEYACSDKLKAMIPGLLLQWKGPLDAAVVEEVQAMSAASIDRYLRQYRGIERRRWNSRSRPGSRLFKRMIPLKSLGTMAPKPGYLQADTVAHGGQSMAGEFLWSLTLTDECAGWTENRSFFGKTAKNAQPALQSAQKRCPLI